MSDGYLGNKNLKAAGTDVEFTKEQVEAGKQRHFKAGFYLKYPIHCL